MKSYYRFMLGRKSAHAAECFAGSFIGTDFSIHEDLSLKLPEEWRTFNRQFIPIILANKPGRDQDRCWARVWRAVDGLEGHQEGRPRGLP